MDSVYSMQQKKSKLASENNSIINVTVFRADAMLSVLPPLSKMTMEAEGSSILLFMVSYPRRE